MFTALFNRKQTELYRLEVLYEGEESEFEHSFGGEACHKGTIPPECSKPVHLFYNLDLSDPQVGITLRWLKKLPLYYALGNQGGPFRYRVVSDSQIELMCQPYPKQYRAGIMRDYLEPFELEKVELDPNGYDANDPEDVWYAGGVLGIAKLTAKQKTTLRKKLEKWHLENIGCPLLDEGDDRPRQSMRLPQSAILSRRACQARSVPIRSARTTRQERLCPYCYSSDRMKKTIFTKSLPVAIRDN
jgi:hypothetical protein